MATPIGPSAKYLWGEIKTTETPDLDTFFAKIWKDGIWGFVGPDFAAAWDSNLPRFKEQIAQITVGNGSGPPLSQYRWNCELSVRVAFRIPTDENDIVARIDFRKHEVVSLSLELGRWKDARQPPPRFKPYQVIGAGQRDTNFDCYRIFEALNARAMTLKLPPFPDGFDAHWRRGYSELFLDPNFPLNKIIADVGTHGICYDTVDLEFLFTLKAGGEDFEYIDNKRFPQLLPEDYRNSWRASWRTTAQRHALHLRIQPLQDLLAKAATHYTEAQMQSAVSAGRPMPELGRMCREMKGIADEIPGLIQNDPLYPLSEDYPLIRRRLSDLQDAYEQVARLCERPERWNITTFPLIMQQFGQDMKGVTRRTQTQRADLERARAQTEREETQRMERERASRTRIKSDSPAKRTKLLMFTPGKRARKRAREYVESQSPSKRSKTGEKDDNDDMMDTTP